MKNSIFLVIASLVVSMNLCGETDALDNPCFTTALTAGYAFKRDCIFKEVYNHGVVNAITADGCYYPWDLWGIGAKVSYWRAHGRTTFLKKCTLLQEVPFTVYARRMFNVLCDLRLYASLGAGFVWMKEESYLGRVRTVKGVGEIEVGATYPLWRCLGITGAFRYLFPRQKQCGQKVQVGGYDLRAGLELAF